MSGRSIHFFYDKGDRIPPDTLLQVRDLIVKGGAVGTSYIDENLRNAYLIGYATHHGRVVGTVTHKHPKDEYRKKIELATGLDLSGYLERGYHSVKPDYRDKDIATRLIEGLIKRSKGQKIYVTIRMSNLPAIRLATKSKSTLAATFINERTGNEIGVFTSEAQ